MPALNHIGMAISSKAVQQTKEFYSEHWAARKSRKLCCEFPLTNLGKGNRLLFVIWFWMFLLLLNSLLPPAAMCVGLRQRWMSSLSVICPSTWIRSSGCSPFAARRAILSLWKRQIWRLMSTTSTQVMIPLSQLQWSLSSLLFRCNLHTSH